MREPTPPVHTISPEAEDIRDASSSS